METICISDINAVTGQEADDAPDLDALFDMAEEDMATEEEPPDASAGGMIMVSKHVSHCHKDCWRCSLTEHSKLLDGNISLGDGGCCVAILIRG